MTSLDDEALAMYRRSRELYLVGRLEEAEIVYRSLRRDHCVELYFEVALPSLMRLVHPLGSVLGRAQYADGLVVYQGVSVGSTVDGERPTFTGPCVLFPGSGVIGNVTVGKNVWLSAGVIIQALPGEPLLVLDNSVVFQRIVADPGTDRLAIGIVSKTTKRSVMAHYFPEAK